MRLRNKLVIIILETALIPLALMAYIGYFNIKNQIIEDTLKRLEVISQIEEHHLRDFILSDSRTLEVMIASIDKYYSDEGYPAPGSASLNAIFRDFMNFKKCDCASFVEEIFIVNPDGQVIISTNSGLVGADVSSEEFFKLGLIKNDFSVFKKSASGGSVVHYFTGPIVVNGKTSGVLVFANKADDIINLTSDYTGLGVTGETLYVRNDGNGNALFLTPTRFDPSAALTRVVPKENINVAAVHAIKGEEAIFDNVVDYRGVPVFAATNYVEDIGWGIVVKIDQSEALAPLRVFWELLFFIFILAASVIFMVGMAISRSITDPLKQLTLGADKIAQGDLSQNIQINSRDEIGLLARSFNVMAGKLKEFHQNLEDKVEERTRNLESRTKELEKLNKLMIGRELKMIELKKKIAELEKKNSSE